MDLTNLKRDIRYSVGDIKEDKFDNVRLTSAINKTINNINARYNINKQSKYINAVNYKHIYSLPDGLLSVVSVRLNNVKLKIINDIEVEAFGTTTNYISYGFGGFGLYPTPTDLSTDVIIVDAAGDTLFDVDNIKSVSVKDGILYAVYDADFTDFTSNLTPVQTIDSGVIQLDYIKDISVEDDQTAVVFPVNFYDVIHFMTAANLLSDDSRTEMRNKSDKFEREALNILGRIDLSSILNYDDSDLVISYTKGI